MPRYVAASESDPLLESRRSPPPSYSEKPFTPRERKSPHCCSVCCTIFSTSATIFLIWIGIYASIGWNYQQRGWRKDQISAVQKNSFGAAALWAITAGISIYFWRRSQRENFEREAGFIRPHRD